MNTLPHLQLQLQQQHQQEQQQREQQQHTQQQQQHTQQQQQQRNERNPELEQHSLFARTETPIDVSDQQQQQQQRSRREEELAKLDQRIQDAMHRKSSLEFTVLYPHFGDDDQQDHFPSPNLTTATSPSLSDPQYQQQYNPYEQLNMDPKDLEAMIRQYCSRAVPPHKNNHHVQDITYDGCMNDDCYDDVEKQQQKDKRKKHQHQRAIHPGVQRVSLNSVDDNVVPNIDNSDSMILSKVEMNKKKNNNKATVPSVMFVRTSDSSSSPSTSSSGKDDATDSKTKQVQFQDPPKRTSIGSASSSAASSSSTASSAASINSQYFELLRQQQLRLVSTRRTQSIVQLEHDVRSKNNMMMTSSTSGSHPRSILTNANDNSNTNWNVEDCDPTSSTFDLSSSTCSNNIYNDHSNASDELCNDNDDGSDSSWSNRMGDYINKASEDGGTLIVVQDRESQTLTLANTNTILSYGGSGNYKKLKPFDSKELVVAVEVKNKRHGSNTKDNEAKFTSAMQFDPQTEDQIVLVKKKMRTMFSIFFIVVMILILIVIGVTAGLVVTRKKHIAASANINKGDASINTEDNKRKNDICQLVSEQMNMNITELNIQYYPNRPYAQAIDWMVHSDPLQLIPTDALFLQRFVLVYLYYAATTMSKQQGPSYHPWSYCGPIVSMNGSYYYDSSHNATTSNDDRTTLSNSTATLTNNNSTSTTVLHTTVCPPPKLSVSIDDEDDVGIFYRFDSKRWLSQYDVCQWMGVNCDRRGHVHSLGLGALNVTGSFPEGIKNLPFLMRYANTVSSMNGPIPGLSIALEFKHLTELQLQHNQLSGTFPQELIYSRNIQSLRLQSNKLIGSLPSSMNEWKDLKQFYVNSNTLSGPIPTSVGTIRSLTFLRLNDNTLHGRIPTEISMIPHLMRLQIEHNELVGPIPKEIGTMTSLSHLSLGQNKLTGTIPIELYNLTSLALFDVQKNDLVGEIASEIGNLKKVVWLMLDGNRLNGTLPTEVGMLSRIKDALFYDNALVGTIPSKLCEIKPQNLEADCYGGRNGTSIPEIVCPYGCCSKCCIASGATCHLMNK